MCFNPHCPTRPCTHTSPRADQLGCVFVLGFSGIRSWAGAVETAAEEVYHSDAKEQRRGGVGRDGGRDYVGGRRGELPFVFAGACASIDFDLPHHRLRGVHAGLR